MERGSERERNGGEGDSERDGGGKEREMRVERR